MNKEEVITIGRGSLKNIFRIKESLRGQNEGYAVIKKETCTTSPLKVKHQLRRFEILLIVHSAESQSLKSITHNLLVLMEVNTL